MSENTATRKRSLLAIGAFVCLVALTGCDSVGGPTPTPTTASESSTADQPIPTTQAPASSSPLPSDAQPAGCPANGETIPTGADTAEIGDVDGDGLADTQWYSVEAPFNYGITTASGATLTLRDDLAGPGGHNGWSAELSNGVVATVLDDGRGASLHAFVGCEFVTPFGVNGKPYRFDMQNLRGNGTGVGCRPTAEGLELLGLQTTRNDGTYDVTATQVIVSPDGSTAENGDTTTEADSVAKGDPAVQEARVSSCSDTPIVGTSGR